MSQPAAAQILLDRFPNKVSGLVEFRGESSLYVSKDALHEVAAYCKDELGFDYLIDVSSVDHFGEEPRFEVVYELSILESSTHLRLKTKVSEDEPTVATVSDLWPTADWHEREVFDMMGIRFDGHPDLRRILMWEGYPYHPLRKDFPLEGKPSDVPDVAFTDTAPLAGGPFVTTPTEGTTQVREPRARRAGDEPPQDKFLAEP
jgi:NADH-quinone oxidoreductase subunit C